MRCEPWALNLPSEGRRNKKGSYALPFSNFQIFKLVPLFHVLFDLVHEYGVNRFLYRGDDV